MREVTMSGVEVTPWKKGVTVHGKYVLSRTLANADSPLHYLENGKGRVAVWGSTVLDGTLADIKQGDYVVIRCEGTLKARKGTAEYWGFRLAVLDPSEVKDLESGKLTVEACFKEPPSGTDKPPKSK